MEFKFRNFGIRYYVILGLDPRISIGNFSLGNFRIPRNDGILEFLGNSNSRCPLGFAVAAVKTRLQDFRAIFGFKAAALA